MKRMWFFLIGLSLACADTSVNPVVDLDETFWLDFGEMASIRTENLEITFQALTGDSRCPKEVVCVWAGEGEIQLLLRQSDTDSAQVDLSIMGFVTKDDSLGHKAADALGYRITFLQLDPYPEENVQVEPKDYKALLNVAKL